MAAALNQQQLKNEATKMAMRVPLFYGNEKEDTMNIKDFLLPQRPSLGYVDERQVPRYRS